jgi:hypothetical protein
MSDTERIAAIRLGGLEHIGRGDVEFLLERLVTAEAALAAMTRERDEWISRFNKLPEIVQRAEERQHQHAERPQDPLFPIQGVGTIPWSLAERAYTRYAQLHGRGQSLQRLAERGGFGLAELGFLLRGYAKRQDSKEDDQDWHHACEFATKEILKALTPPAPPEASPCVDHQWYMTGTMVTGGHFVPSTGPLRCLKCGIFQSLEATAHD